MLILSSDVFTCDVRKVNGRVMYYWTTQDDVQYRYSPATGNLSMYRPGKWRGLAVMDRMPSRAKGVLPGKPNDPAYALAVAENHLRKYRPRAS